MGSALVKRRHSNVSYLNKMNAFITIGYKKNGKSEILLSPDEPYAKHRQLFKTLTGDYTDVEVWSRAMGKIKQRKVKTSKVAKVSKTSKKSNEQKIGVDDICRIRPEYARDDLRLCDYSYDGAAQKLGFFGVAPTHSAGDKCNSG